MLKKITNKTITIKLISCEISEVVTAVTVSNALNFDNSIVVLIYASMLSIKDSIKLGGVSIFLFLKTISNRLW